MIDNIVSLLGDRAEYLLKHTSQSTTVLWCYLRNNAVKKDKDYHLSADLTGQANHLGCTIQANIIKQNFRKTTAATRPLIPEVRAMANSTSVFAAS